jgi:hypothetical protein
MGSFVFGRAGRSVGEVEVRVGDRAPMTVATIAAPGGRAWVAHAGLTCAEVEVHALDRRTGSAGKRRAGRIGPPGCGQPRRIITAP